MVDSFDYSTITCNECGQHDWADHCSYKRTIDPDRKDGWIFITRIICKHCGKTHAILISDLVPYSTLNYTDIIKIVVDKTKEVCSNHLYFLKKKYHDVINSTYEQICFMNRRNNVFIYVST